MKRFIALLALSVLLPFAGRSAAQNVSAALEAALADPPATGLLVTQVFDETQAARIGLLPGDVVVSYADSPTPDLETLAARKQDVMGEAAVPMVAVRGTEELVFEVMPGQIGFQAVPVVKGQPPAPLPEATLTELDFSSLGDEPVERWYEFYLGGEKKGYETWTISRSGGRVFLSSEVGFDGGEGFGLNHMKVNLAMTDAGRPRLIFCRYENALNGWTSVTTQRMSREGLPLLDYRWWFGEDRGESRAVSAPEGLIPTYFVQSIARLMPREEGACYHFRPLEEGFGRPGLRSAVICRGLENVPEAEEPVPAWRYEWVDFTGSVGSTSWISDAGETLRVDWGGAVGVLVTKETALKGVDPTLHPAD